MSNLRSYPKHKDSGVTWIGLIPEGWEVVRNKHFLKEFNVPSQNGNEDLLTVSQYTGITRRKDRLSDENDLLTKAKTLEGYKIVERGSMVMNIMLAWNGSLGLSDYNGIVSPAYAVFRVNQKNVYPKFLHYLHRTKLYTGIFETASTGVIKSRLRLYPEKYLALHSVLPPLNEQFQIACYLDWKTSQINKLIKAKKRQIELLKEQKQVIINDAVTGKIDVRTGKPYPKYKDSGVDWLGKVPEDWEIRRLKYIVRNINEQTNLKENDELYIALENVESWTGRINLCFEEVAFESQVKRFKSDDILFGKLRPYLAKVVKSTFRGVCVGEFLVLRKCVSDLSTDFLAFKLRSYSIIHHINKSTFGAKMPRADWDFIGNMLFSVPIFYETQEAIAEYISKRNISIDKSIDTLEKEIILLKEYQVRIICDIVTGKFEVRSIEVPQYDEEVEESRVDEEVADQIKDVEMAEKDSEDNK